MMQHISTPDILAQLKADLIGKDSYRGVTLTYAWLSNQFGHFSLGFIPTLIAYAILQVYYPADGPALISACTISLIWLLFELYNFSRPIIRRRGYRDARVSENIEHVFKAGRGNMAFDTFTDICFFWLGAFSAAMLLEPGYQGGVILISLIVILIYPAWHWFLTKMYIQGAKYPYQLRLCQWDHPISERNCKIVNDFINNQTRGKHLFIYGQRHSGKTALSVGMATELSIRHLACTYTTAIKLYNMFERDKRRRSRKTFWSWRDASLMIIDDINPCYPTGIPNELISPSLFLQFLDRFSDGNPENREIIRQKNIIWVLGSEYSDAIHSRWVEMLIGIGVKKEDIWTIDLN